MIPRSNTSPQSTRWPENTLAGTGSISAPDTYTDMDYSDFSTNSSMYPAFEIGVQLEPTADPVDLILSTTTAISPGEHRYIPTSSISYAYASSVSPYSTDEPWSVGGEEQERSTSMSCSSFSDDSATDIMTIEHPPEYPLSRSSASDKAEPPCTERRSQYTEQQRSISFPSSKSKQSIASLLSKSARLRNATPQEPLGMGRSKSGQSIPHSGKFHVKLGTKQRMLSSSSTSHLPGQPQASRGTSTSVPETAGAAKQWTFIPENPS